jgi:hypothetical protein
MSNLRLLLRICRQSLALIYSPNIPPNCSVNNGRTRPGPLPHDHRFRRALRHAAPVGDGLAGGVFALRPDAGVDVAGVEQGGRVEVGDHTGVVQGGAVAAVSGGVEAFEDIGPGGDGLADGGPERCISFPRARGVRALWGTSGGITARGRPERKAICAAPGSAQLLNPAAG